MDTFDYFTDPKTAPSATDIGKPWYEAHMVKRNELKKLMRLDDGAMVFRAWAEQFKGRTMADIAAEIGGEPSLVADWPAMRSHEEWLRVNEPGDLFVATLDYSATGEGHTIRVIAANARSLAHFILHCGERVGGYYFVIGMDFHRGVPQGDPIFDLVVPKAALNFFSKRCSVDVDLTYHINCS